MIKETYVIRMTQECNCDCVYCYERDKTSVYDWDGIKSLLDNILKYNEDKFAIEFLGGEPCLRTDLIRKTVEYLPNVDTFIITTNGTLVDDNLISLLKEDKRVNWIASIDGHKVANMLRVFRGGVNTYQAVVDNYHKLLDAGIPNEQTGFHITAQQYNVGYIHDSVHHLYSLGFRTGAVGLVESWLPLTEEFGKEYKRQMFAISRDWHLGRLPGLALKEFSYINPADDDRTYIRNKEGSVIGESYGRAPGDVTKQEIEGITCETPGGLPGTSDVIRKLREEVHYYHQTFSRTYGCGVGRNGSRTLTEALRREFPDRLPMHESKNPLLIPYEFDEDVLTEIVASEWNIVQNSLMSYAEALLQSENIRIICIRRDREEYVESFLTSRKFSPERSWLEQETPELYPKYGDIPLREGLRRYWDEYYAKAEQLSIDYDNFKLVEFEDFITFPLIKKIENEAHEDTGERSCSCRKGKKAIKN